MDQRPNVFEIDFEFDPADPEGYRCGVAFVGRYAGAGELAVKLYEVPPYESIAPYHYEYVEEWLLVLDGEVYVRVPTGTEALSRGQLMRFPPGPEGGHKVTNPGGINAVVLMFSSARAPAVAVYPDSDKIGVWTGNPEDDAMFRRVDGRVPYFDGEA